MGKNISGPSIICCKFLRLQTARPCAYVTKFTNVSSFQLTANWAQQRAEARGIGYQVCTGHLLMAYMWTKLQTGWGKQHTRPGRVWIGLVLVWPYEEPSIRVFEVIWKVFESSFRWDIAAWYAPSSDRVTEQNEEGCWQTPGELSVQSSKQNNHALMWKQDVSLPLWLSLGCFLELGKLPYLIWKRPSRATC